MPNSADGGPDLRSVIIMSIEPIYLLHTSASCKLAVRKILDRNAVASRALQIGGEAWYQG